MSPVQPVIPPQAGSRALAGNVPTNATGSCVPQYDSVSMTSPHPETLLPQVVSQDVAIFTVTVAARLAGMHPQTLRTYDRLGLVVPQRTRGSGRRYAPRDVARLRLIQRLSQDEGINLEGIRRIIALQDQLDDALAQIDKLTALAQQLISDGRPVARVFTAETDGRVWPGRHRAALRQLAA